MLSILIPAYNEASSIVNTVEQVRRVLDGAGIVHEIIVINDGSKDNTGELAETTPAHVIHHPINAGYGRALKTGMSQAQYDWIGIIDADLTYPVERFPELLSYIPKFDMVVGERTGKHYWGSTGKRLSRSLLLWLVSYVTGRKCPDANSGMRIFRKEYALQHIRQISSGFSFTTTLTLAFLLEGRFVLYLPIDYHEREGQSKVRIGIDSLRTLQMLVQAILYYNPLKLFLPVCFLVLLIGMVAFLIDLVTGAHSGVALLTDAAFTSILVGTLGFLTEAIRLHRIGTTP